MIEINNKKDCSGCGACACICPQKCISMQSDEEGFLYPHIEKTSCVNCGMCQKVCPVINKRNHEEQYSPYAFLTRSKNIELLKKCTSGGLFTTIAKSVVEHGGIAFGASYDENHRIKHTSVNCGDQIYRLSGSKYVQSDTNNTYIQVKKHLKQDKKVLFCGTPCQVEGLVNFLQGKNDNLLLIDLVCHGVPSPLLWEKYLSYSNKKNGKHKSINFRSKKLGYHVSVMEEMFENGKTKYGSARTNLMLKSYFKNIADRPICYTCPFKCIDRVSDITLFDGWHASSYVNNLKDDDKGYTIALVHSEKGKSVLNHIKSEIDIFPIDAEKAIELDGKMAIESVVLPDGRNYFYKYLQKYGLEKTINKLAPIKKTDHIVEKSKLVLKRIGLLNIIKKIKG